MHDLVIRGGTLVDGTGAAARSGDLAIDGDRITSVGGKAGGDGIDARLVLAERGGEEDTRLELQREDAGDHGRQDRVGRIAELDKGGLHLRLGDDPVGGPGHPLHPVPHRVPDLDRKARIALDEGERCRDHQLRRRNGRRTEASGAGGNLGAHGRHGEQGEGKAGAHGSAAAQSGSPGCTIGSARDGMNFGGSNSCAQCAPMRMKTGSLRPRGGSAPPARTLRAAAQRAHFGASTPPIFETGAITSKFVRAGIDCLERPEDCIACIQN